MTTKSKRVGNVGVTATPRGNIRLFTGRKQAGKNTAAQWYIDRGYTELSFAKPIKDIVLTLDPVIASEMTFQLETGVLHTRSGLFRVSDFINAGHTLDELKESHAEVRRLLQVTGTEVGRSIDSDLWVKQVLKTIEADPEKSYVITDGRFHNEAAMVHELKGLALWVRNDVAEAAPVKHESELYAGELGEDYELDNNGTIDELHAQIEAIEESLTP